MIQNALIIGGGIAGMTAAMSLKRAGVSVTLIDADPEWRVYGAGISLTGLALRAFDDLGLLNEVRRRGRVRGGMTMRAVTGDLLFEAPVPENPLPIDSGGGIMRPVLHDIFSSTVRAEGVVVRLGIKPAALSQDDQGVDIRFSDGTSGRFDLVVGADGIYSWVRQQILPDSPKPKFTGQGCWRVVAPRPASLQGGEMYIGGPVKAGINPVSPDEVYSYILEHVPDNPRFAPENMLPHLRQLLTPFGGALKAIREGLSEKSMINYRPLEWLLLPDPWYSGRVVLIGDAVHATTPHMAAGAGVAAEDGIVLAQEIARHESVPAALKAFVARRFERASVVVKTSVGIGENEMAGGDPGLAAGMIGQALQQLRAPY